MPRSAEMPRVSSGTADTDEPKRTRTTTNALRSLGLLIGIGALVLVVLLSIAVGSKQIPLPTVLQALFDFNGSTDHIVIRDLRLPRTLLGVAVGAALGLAGALMQALTRNPLADPGLLGVNAGASAAVVTAIGFFGVTSLTGYVWFAFAGAAAISLAVYVLGATGRSGATPVRLALAGTAIGAALTAYISAITLTNTEVFDRFRFWAVGSLAGRESDVVMQVLPFLVAGLLVGLSLARPLNALALGEDTGKALGAHIGRTRILGAVAITLLCGAATAAVGPIGFIGLTIPHVARAITGPDQRWVLPYSVVLAPILLLGSDIIGRIVVPPSELEVGIVTAAVGAPFFIYLVRRRRIAQL
ncbi:FecCD family ABC transporter permease [Tenggerimyces flavus]|uniref:FecCD family ABC transporter permease n=1 Tax=Tenggerimyces flavus TaxID=1708749 RepID=A0ABV7YPC7_9ACTN|nr:iron chelate uptake ABC transporter family permease subunit [Tenggerimyces flavus]MBM7784455.1 iron complex transport system permease protein [Tenggerimyces flavus]